MKKAPVMGLAALVAGMSLGIAAPARAQTCGTVPPPPAANTISLEDGQIRVNPSGPAQDVEGLDGYGDDRVNEAADCVPPQGWCPVLIAFSAVNQWYTYQDPDTGEIVIDYGRLVDHTSCLI